MKPFYYSKIASALLAASLLGGCVSLQDGDRMQAQLDQLSSRQSALDESFAENREQFEAMVRQAHSDVEQIRKVLKDATELMQRNSADFGADFERFQQEFSALRGQVETLNFNLEKTEKDLNLFKEDVDLRFNSSAPVAKSSTSDDAAPNNAQSNSSNSLGSDPKAMLSTANDFLRVGKYDEAKETYMAFLTTFPDDKNVDQAIFGLGETELRLRNPKAAGKQFEKILSKYPNSQFIDDSFFKLGEVFVDLGSCKNAAKFYKRVITKYKDSPWVSKSKARLDAIDKKKLCK